MIKRREEYNSSHTSHYNLNRIVWCYDSSWWNNNDNITLFYYILLYHVIIVVSSL